MLWSISSSVGYISILNFVRRFSVNSFMWFFVGFNGLIVLALMWGNISMTLSSSISMLVL